GDDRVNAWQVELRGATARRTGDAYVVHLSTSMQPQALVDLDRRLTDAVGHAPLQLLVNDPADVDAAVAIHGWFVDSRPRTPTGQP
ncbi:MAG: hypothetical protein M3N57_00150, partial [Actinomycetota bacterium]|nr:hypothetical protein [Actinomycetota bacterium]